MKKHSRCRMQDAGLAGAVVPVKPLVRWAGGKTRLLKYLLPLVPEHRLRVEVFGGGLALTLALPKMRGEVVNDISAELITLYRCAQRHLPEMQRMWQWESNARVNFRDYVQQPGLTDIERSVRYLLRLRTCFGSNPCSFAVQREPNSSAASGLSRINDIMEAWSRRMDGVTIENVTWQRLLDIYDCPHAFFFMDPPYVCPDIDGYSSFTPADMEEIAVRLCSLKGRWLLTVNASEENKALFAGYPVQEVWRASGAAKSTSRKKHGELIISDGRGGPSGTLNLPTD